MYLLIMPKTLQNEINKAIINNWQRNLKEENHTKTYIERARREEERVMSD